MESVGDLTAEMMSLAAAEEVQCDLGGGSWIDWNLNRRTRRSEWVSGPHLCLILLEWSRSSKRSTVCQPREIDCVNPKRVADVGYRMEGIAHTGKLVQMPYRIRRHNLQEAGYALASLLNGSP